MIYTVSIKSRESQGVSASMVNTHILGVMDMSIYVEANSIPEALDKARDLLAITEEVKEKV